MSEGARESDDAAAAASVAPAVPVVPAVPVTSAYGDPRVDVALEPLALLDTRGPAEALGVYDRISHSLSAVLAEAAETDQGPAGRP